MQDVVAEAKAIASAQKTNKIIGEAKKGLETKGLEEQVNWTSHRDMKLKRDPGTCHWCGNQRGPHPWKSCPANGKTCAKCGGNDHFAKVCLEEPLHRPGGRPAYQNQSRRSNQRFDRTQSSNNTRRYGRTPSRYRENIHHLGMTDNKEDMSDEFEQYNEQCYTLEAEQVHNVNTERPGKIYFANLSMSETGLKFKNVKFQIDTAAICHIISEATLKTLLPDTKIQKSSHLLYPYGNSKPLHPIGQVELLCERERKFETLTDSERLGLITIKADEIFTLSTAVNSKMGNTDNLPSFKLLPAQESDFTSTGPKPQVAANYSNSLTRNHQEQTHNNCPKVCTPPPTPSKPIKIPAIRKLPPPGQLKEEHILQEYAETFSGLGCLGPPVHFTTKDNMSPIQMPVHRVPVAKREKEKVALDWYEQEGVIKKVEEPTPWCSNELIKETPKKFQICIDPSQTINKAMLRPIYQMPTLNEQLHKLCDAKCFTMLDVRDGFLHAPQDEESSHMTTMHTTYGRYRWLRLPFGITSAPEEFQKRLIIALEGLEGVICIANDILVFGEGDDYKQAEKDHDRRLIALMERCIQQNIKLNAGKLQFKLKEVKFMGNINTSSHLKA